MSKLKLQEKEFREFDLDEIIANRKEKKMQSIRFSYFLNEININNKYVSDTTIERISNCGTFLEFITTADFKKNKLSKANFCGNRFCPHCSYNKSHKEAEALFTMLKYLYNDYEFLFLTLTTPNVKGNELASEIELFSKAFGDMRKKREYANIVKGYMRKLEVTYNFCEDTYNPHYHVLLAVDKDYFTNKNKYIEQPRWLEMWQEVTHNDEIKIVDIRKFEKNKLSSIFEMTKYMAKDSDYLHSRDIFEIFYISLKGKRDYAFGGVFRNAKSKFKRGELNHLRDNDQNFYIYKNWFCWDRLGKNYNQKRYCEPLTDEELIEYNSDFFDVIDDKKVFE